MNIFMYLFFGDYHATGTQNGERAQEQLEFIQSFLKSPHSVLSYTYLKASKSLCCYPLRVCNGVT